MNTTSRHKKTYTVNDAARRYGRVPSGIRRICIENDIGELIEGRVRLLTGADVKKIGQVIAGKRDYRKSSEKRAVCR